MRDLDAEAIARAATRKDTAPPGTDREIRTVRERSGVIAGRMLGPEVKLVARVRRARVFHPSGVVFSAEARSVANDGPARRVASRLAGHAVVRFSGALWKRGDRWPDVLGCAIRFCQPGAELAPGPDGQDLLLATLRSPATMGIAPFGTRTSDFLANIYYGAAPFLLEGVGSVKLRARSEAAPTPRAGPNRAERLIAAVEEGAVRLLLEWKRHLVPELWKPLVELRLVSRTEIDQRLLRFNPFLAGRGLHPRGFIHAMRRVAYPESRIGSGVATP